MPYADLKSERAREVARAASRRHYARHREAEIARSAKWNAENRDICNTTARERRSQRTPVEVVLWRNAKYRAIAKGLPFTIEVADIKVPKVCPVLGIELAVGTGHAKPNSPSLDRIDPTRGYEPDNIAVLSHKANTIKSNASIEELRAVLSYLEDKA